MKRQTSNLAVFGELGRLPLALKAHLSVLKYWNRIRNMDRDTIVNKAYWENVRMDSNWCKTVQHLNVMHNLHDRRNFNRKKFPNIAKKAIWDNFVLFWKATISDQNIEKKLGFYSKCKDEFVPHSYLDLPDFHDRQRIAKLVCSDHPLEIERGRYRGNKKPRREDRICTTCDLGAMEDEKHFLLDCPAYGDIRKSIFGDDMTNNLKPEELVKSFPPTILTKYLKRAYKYRDDKFAVVGISLDYMRLTIRISKPTEERPPEVPSQLETSFSSPGALKFKIRRRKCKN